jgi:hypothetical protein
MSRESINRAMPGPVGGVPCPAGGRLGYLPFFRAPQHGLLLVASLSPQIQGWVLHWHDGRTVPCLAPDPQTDTATRNARFCPCCAAGTSWRWEGFLCGVRSGDRKRGIIVVTQGAYLHSETLQEKDGSLVGKILEMGRSCHSKRGPVSVKVRPEEVKGPLPPAWELRESLLYIWGFRPAGPADPGPSPAEEGEA